MNKPSINDYFLNWGKKQQIVTIFLLTHKRPNYVKLAIESVLKQTYKNFYLIILDNLSQDNTKNVIDSFNDDRLIYIEHDSLLSGGSNYLYAFELVQTKYLIILHDDDVLEYSYISTIVSLMEKHNDVVLASPTANIIDSYGNLVKKGKNSMTLNILHDSDYFVNYYLAQKPGMIYPAVIYRKSFFPSILDFLNTKAGPAGDQYLYFETCRKGGKIAILEYPLINYRIHNSQDSFVRGSNMNLSLISFLWEEEYYRNAIIANKGQLYNLIKKDLISTIHLYHMTKNKNLAKENYRQIPKICKKSFKGKFYSFVMAIMAIMPGLVCRTFFIVRRIVKRGK